MLAPEDQWIAIQHKTFVNWANEQLTVGNRSVENLGTDLCDGVNLVALVEALQFKKIGKVYSKPTSRIQMLQNVSLALQAVASDNVKLVNIGTDDIVGGNLKLILGLLWHLIIRYQISSNKTRAPPKKLMLSWLQSALPGVKISNFSTDWNDGIALNALVEHCKPGLSPNWKELSPKEGVQNCRQAMQLAKEHLGVPKVVSPEDFASSSLDELSAMTYLSYFIRKNSPGYYGTLNWVCKQLKTTNISNMTTDWNDGFFLCSLVHSLGGTVHGWPDLDRTDHLALCQSGIDSAKTLGVEPILTAAELSDPKVDHLAVMAYISKFRNIQPRKGKAEKVDLKCDFSGATVGNTTDFKIMSADADTDQSKVTVKVSGPSSTLPCEVDWSNKIATCSFEPQEAGVHMVHVYYDGEEVHGCPVSFLTKHDINKIKFAGQPNPCRMGQPYTVEISCPDEICDSVEVRSKSPSGDLNILITDPTPGGLKGHFRPSAVGQWQCQVFIGSQEVTSLQLDVFNPVKAFLSGPDHGHVGQQITYNVNVRECGSTDIEVDILYSGGRTLSDVTVTSLGDICQISFIPKMAGLHSIMASIKDEAVTGSPKNMEIVDPSQILVKGDGLIGATKGMESHFSVKKQGLLGEIHAEVEVSGMNVPLIREERGDEFDFCYLPVKVGLYKITVLLDEEEIPGSPYAVPVTDKSHVVMLDDLSKAEDENGHIALEFGKPTRFSFDVSQAGPGIFTAEVLSPDGKLPVDVEQDQNRAAVSFNAKSQGDHYIHLYWSDAPVEYSPLLAYCPGPPLPVDATKVTVIGKGAYTARATVPAEFIIDGRKAGPGIPKVQLQGIQAELPVEMQALKYDRYKCRYTSKVPGSFLLYIWWSGTPLAGSPLKINITAKGSVRKVKVTGDGLNGGVAGHELKIFVDTTEAGPGEVTAECHSHRHNARCDVKENSEGHYTLRVLPTEPEKHILQIKYDGVNVPGSPFIIKVGEPPDPTKVKVFGPGIEDGIIDMFESRFLVDTAGAGAGQLAVKIKGPRGGFRVDMQRETESERTIVCRYDPREPGEYVINVRWSGVHVPGSPFIVHVVDTRQDLNRLIEERGFVPREEQLGWRVEV